ITTATSTARISARAIRGSNNRHDGALLRDRDRLRPYRGRCGPRITDRRLDHRRAGPRLPELPVVDELIGRGIVLRTRRYERLRAGRRDLDLAWRRHERGRGSVGDASTGGVDQSELDRHGLSDLPLRAGRGREEAEEPIADDVVEALVGRVAGVVGCMACDRVVAERGRGNGIATGCRDTGR